MKRKKKGKERKKKSRKNKKGEFLLKRGRFYSAHHSFPFSFFFYPFVSLYSRGSPSRNLNEVDIMPLRVPTDRLASPFLFLFADTHLAGFVVARFSATPNFIPFAYIYIYIYIYFIDQGGPQFPSRNNQPTVGAIISINSPLIWRNWIPSRTILQRERVERAPDPENRCGKRLFHLPSILIGGHLKPSLLTNYANINRCRNVIRNNEIRYKYGRRNYYYYGLQREEEGNAKCWPTNLYSLGGGGSNKDLIAR